MNDAATPQEPPRPPDDTPHRVRRVEVPADWNMLAFAFADDTAGVRWYLHVGTGAVVRAHEMESSVFASDPAYVFIERARSREQYRWLERFIASLDDRALAAKLFRAIGGKQAFQRFKATLAEHPGLSRIWFDFRNDQINRHVQGWLAAHNLSVPRPGQPSSKTEEPIAPTLLDHAVRIDQATAGLDAEDLEALLAFAEFLLLGQDHAPLRAPKRVSSSDEQPQPLLVQGDSQ